MRVAALSGSRSRLMEENTGTQTNTKLTRVHHIGRRRISSRQDEMLPGYFTVCYQTKQAHKALRYIFNGLAFISPAAGDTSRPGELHSFPSFLSLLHCSELVSVLIQLAAVLLAHNNSPTAPQLSTPLRPQLPSCNPLKWPESAAPSWVVLGVEKGFSVEGRFKWAPCWSLAFNVIN